MYKAEVLDYEIRNSNLDQLKSHLHSRCTYCHHTITCVIWDMSGQANLYMFYYTVSYNITTFVSLSLSYVWHLIWVPPVFEWKLLLATLLLLNGFYNHISCPTFLYPWFGSVVGNIVEEINGDNLWEFSLPLVGWLSLDDCHLIYLSPSCPLLCLSIRFDNWCQGR